MKVILITQDFYPLTGGIATYLLQMYNNYFQRDDFSVVVPKKISKDKDYKKLNFPVNRLVFSPFSSFEERSKESKIILNLLKQENPDLVLFGYLRSHPEIAEEYKKYNPKCKWGIILHAKEAFLDPSIRKTTHKDGIQKGYTKKETIGYKRILNSADFLICVSKFTKKLIKSQKIKNKIFIINPSLILNHLSTNKNINPNKFVLLSVGRLIKRKGQDLVIKSLKNLEKDIPNLKYIIVGTGPEKDNLKKMAKKEKVSKIISFLGKVSEKNLPSVYSSCDIFVLPTRHIYPNDVEGFGIVFLEANFYSKPVIGGSNGGVIEAIKKNKSGFLIKQDNLKNLTKKILFLYKNPNKKLKMGNYGRKRVLKGFFNKKNNSFENYLSKLRFLNKI